MSGIKKGVVVKHVKGGATYDWYIYCERNGIDTSSNVIAKDVDVKSGEIMFENSNLTFNLADFELVENRANKVIPNVEIRWCDPVGEYCIYIDGQWAGYFNLEDYQKGE